MNARGALDNGFATVGKPPGICRRVLFITHAFAPACSSPVFRPLKFVKFLPQYGWQPVVVTTRKTMPPLDAALLGDIPRGVQVHEVFSLFPGNLDALLLRKRRRRELGDGRYLFLRTALKLFSVLYYRMVVVDWHDGWVPFAVIRAAQILARQRVDLIFVDMEPPSSALIGILLKKASGLPMIIDYHDPWTTSVYAREKRTLKMRLAEKIEHGILTNADLVTAGKKQIIEEIREKFRDIPHDKLTTIPSGFDPEDYRGIAAKKRDRFVITYTGKISDKFYYSPETFLTALAELIREAKTAAAPITVNFVGPVAESYRRRLDDLVRRQALQEVVVWTGPVDHHTCLTYQVNSDALLFIVEAAEGKDRTERFAGALPSKIYEYIYTRIPILAIVPAGAEADLIRSTRSGFLAEPHNVESVKAAMRELLSCHYRGERDFAPDAAEIEKYNRRSLTGRLARRFGEVCQSGLKGGAGGS